MTPDERIVSRLGTALIQAHQRNELRAGVGTKLIQDAQEELEHETWLRGVDSVCRQVALLVRARHLGRPAQRQEIMDALGRIQ